MKSQNMSFSFLCTLMGSLIFSLICKPGRILERFEKDLKETNMTRSDLKFVENVWSNETLELLTAMFRADALPSLSADDIPNSKYDNIGEAIDPDEDGSCPMRYTINKRGNKCVFLGRLDLIENFVKTGGIDGNKMSVDRLYQQANGFITQKKGKTLEVMKKIAAESVLNDHVIESCKEHEIIDNVLMTFLVIVPGHALPVHYDVPLFKNIPKENAPVWLHVAYALSGLAKKEEIRQVQFVSYLSGNENSNNGGDFTYWPEGPNGPKKVRPVRKNSALVTDGVHVAHGVTEWHPNGVKKQAPKLNKDDKNSIQYIGDGKWQIMVNGKPTETYDESELRMSLVSRYQCFKNQEEKDAFHSKDGKQNVHHMISKLKKHMGLSGQKLSPEELFDAVTTKYVRYSSSTNSLISFNYCILPELAPKWLKLSLKLFLSPFCQN